MHHVTFNGIVDLPVGKGKRFLGNTNRLLNALVGGYQVAFVGQVVSQSFQVASANWGATSPVESIWQLGSDHRLPQRRLPSGISVVQRIYLADRDQRGQERHLRSSRQLQPYLAPDQQYAGHARTSAITM